MAAMPPPFLQAVAVALVLAPPALASRTLVLELRVFNGTDEVTAHTRVTVHRAGERGGPAAQADGTSGRLEINLPEGIYDIQAIEHREGRVVNIQWANRIVLMPYPDEQGRHLEVLNFNSSFGALQVRGRGTALPDVRLHGAGVPRKDGIVPLKAPGYLLFVVPAGMYDVLVPREGGVHHRLTAVEVPRDRTRLWILPETY